jgi:hypothetical protein
MQLETQVSNAPGCCARPGTLNRLGRKGWVLLGAAALALLALGFAWQWSWLVAIGIAPFLISTAPCLAMCALGLCMHGMGKQKNNVTSQAMAPVSLSSESPQTQEL